MSQAVQDHVKYYIIHIFRASHGIYLENMWGTDAFGCIVNRNQSAEQNTKTKNILITFVMRQCSSIENKFNKRY